MFGVISLGLWLSGQVVKGICKLSHTFEFGREDLGSNPCSDNFSGEKSYRVATFRPKTNDQIQSFFHRLPNLGSFGFRLFPHSIAAP